MLYLAATTSTAGTDAASLALFIALGVFGFVAYWVPTAVAMIRHHRSPGPIVIINLFLGWTVIGWIVALAMAVSGPSAQVPQAQVWLPPGAPR